MARRDAHTLRIIGGTWRGRKIAVNSSDGLRPTPDRIRETLFNWLAPRIEGARCLDLFAGTGALGLEALSRGAGHVTFVERDGDNAKALRQALTTLDSHAADVIQGDALNTAAFPQTSYDVIFVDPPFTASLHPAVLAAIESLATIDTRVYLEYPVTQTGTIEQLLPPTWWQLRGKRAGSVGYSLVCRRAEQP